MFGPNLSQKFYILIYNVFNDVQRRSDHSTQHLVDQRRVEMKAVKSDGYHVIQYVC